MDAYSLPMAREQVIDEDILQCKHEVVNHLSLSQCAGFEGSSFHKVQCTWRDIQVQCA